MYQYKIRSNILISFLSQSYLNELQRSINVEAVRDVNLLSYLVVTITHTSVFISYPNA
jgi:hypothetical protein